MSIANGIGTYIRNSRPKPNIPVPSACLVGDARVLTSVLCVTNMRFFFPSLRLLLLLLLLLLKTINSSEKLQLQCQNAGEEKL